MDTIKNVAILCLSHSLLSLGPATTASGALGHGGGSYGNGNVAIPQDRGDVSCNMVGGQFWMLWGCWERREGRDILLGTGIPPVLMGHQRAGLPQGPGFPALNLSLL